MENSKIQWTDHTFNPWWGCMKVSPGCKNCYAELLDKRFDGGHWGPSSIRKPMSDKYWAQPFNWNRSAQRAGVKAKVFCASMADVFEGKEETLPWLERLFAIIEATPHLIWQLLTKRPENIMNLVPASWRQRFPDNVWIGASVENQEAVDNRIHYLVDVPAIVRFLSCEPLLGPIDLTRVAAPKDTEEPLINYKFNCLTQGSCYEYEYEEGRWDIVDGPLQNGIDWVIAGGESGPAARPTHTQWLRELKEQCDSDEVAFFFKQWGEWVPEDQHSNFIPGNKVHNVKNILPDGSEYTQGYIQAGILASMKKVGKGLSGNLMDGKTYMNFPKQ